MSVPGLTPELPLRAKVRVGEKNAKGYPSSVEAFLCSDPEYLKVAGERPKTLRITFPYQTVNEAFPSGLEKWMKARSGPILGCYTKGDGTAHRLGDTYLPDGSVKLDPTVKGMPRNPMPCQAQQCPYFGAAPSQGCRPQARLNFQLVGGPRDSVYRFETKGLGTIQGITAVLSQYSDLRGVEFDLNVKIVKQGANQFPVVSLAEVVSPVQSDQPIEESVDHAPGEAAPLGTDAERALVAGYLRQLGQEVTPEVANWIKSVGYAEAAVGLERRVVKLMEKEDKGG